MIWIYSLVQEQLPFKTPLIVIFIEPDDFVKSYEYTYRWDFLRRHQASVLRVSMITGSKPPTTNATAGRAARSHSPSDVNS